MPRDSQGRFAPADLNTFMKLHVERGDILLVTTTQGDEVVPCDLVCQWPGQKNDEAIIWDGKPGAMPAGQKEWMRQISEYCEGAVQAVALKVNVYYGRYSAPGYMDCTSWSWSRNRRELEAELNSMYGDE